MFPFSGKSVRGASHSHHNDDAHPLEKLYTFSTGDIYISSYGYTRVCHKLTFDHQLWPCFQWSKLFSQMFRNPQHWWLDCHIRSKCVTHKWNTEAENPSKILPTISGWSDTLFTVLTEFQTKSQHFNESANLMQALHCCHKSCPGLKSCRSTVLPRRAASGHWGWKRCNYYYETGRRGAPKYCRGQDRKKKIELPGLDKNL